MLPKNRPPTSPGEMLREEFLSPMGMTQGDLAARMGIPIQRINLILNGKRNVTADTALRLSAVFGTTPEFWMNLQNSWDLWHARREAAESLKSISLFKVKMPGLRAKATTSLMRKAQPMTRPASKTPSAAKGMKRRAGAKK